MNERRGRCTRTRTIEVTAVSPVSCRNDIRSAARAPCYAMTVGDQAAATRPARSGWRIHFAERRRCRRTTWTISASPNQTTPTGNRTVSAGAPMVSAHSRAAVRSSAAATAMAAPATTRRNTGRRMTRQRALWLSRPMPHCHPSRPEITQRPATSCSAGRVSTDEGTERRGGAPARRCIAPGVTPGSRPFVPTPVDVSGHDRERQPRPEREAGFRPAVPAGTPP
jgi:hypothetical protein